MARGCGQLQVGVTGPHHAVLPVFPEPQRQIAERLSAGLNRHLLVVREAMHLHSGVRVSGIILSLAGTVLSTC